jgi:hypothetical protein
MNRRRSWFELQSTTSPSSPPPTPPETLERSMPRALAGWPEGSVYTPRTPLFFADLFPETARIYTKQHRGRGRRGDDSHEQ